MRDDFSPTAWRGALGGRERVFDLTIGGAAAVERATGVYLGELMQRLAFGSWPVAGILEPIRHGLLGAGESDDEVAALMAEVERGPVGARLQLAADIVSAFVNGRQAVLDAKKAASEGPGDLASDATPAGMDPDAPAT